MTLRNLLRGIVLAGVAALAPAAGAQNASASQSEVDHAIAVFIASNVKLAVDNALQSIAVTGIDCDTAAVRTMIAAELARPYDAAEHVRANDIVDAAMAAKARSESDAMLKAAAARPGATVTPSGLVFEVIEDADGPEPTASDRVSIRYTGMLPDGSVFDSIGPADEPLVAIASDLTPGMTEGLTMMHKGGKYRLTMPAELGYGANGVPGVIPPDCVLQFDVQLTDILQ